MRRLSFSAASTRQATARSALPSPTRFEFLDALRGLAAVAVFLVHAGAMSSPAFLDFSLRHFNLGQTGVIVFFLISGYIIPHAMERSGNLRRFWIRRACRLYPLYWVTCGLVMLLPGSDWHSFVINLTMVPGFFGVQPFVAVFWTLQYELLFYVSLSALFALRLQSHLPALTIYLLVSAMLLFPLSPPLSTVVAYIGLMYAGGVLYRLHTGEVSRRVAALVGVLTIAAMVVTAWGPEVVKGWGLAESVKVEPVALIITRLTALTAFVLAAQFRRGRWPRLLVLVGDWTYSIYLLHAFILVLVPKTPTPALTILVWLGVTLLLSRLTYRTIELPLITLGQRLTSGSARRQADGSALSPAQVG